jgi:DNA-binding NarL/FixJ family response regulator
MPPVVVKQPGYGTTNGSHSPQGREAGIAWRDGDIPATGQDGTPARRLKRDGSEAATPRAIALIDDHEFTRDCIATCLEVLCRGVVVTPFRSIADCVSAGSGRFELVIYYARTTGARPEGGCPSLQGLWQDLGPAPVLIVSDDDDVGTMLDALTAGVRGYVPTISTSLQITVEVMNLLRAGGTFAPVAPSFLRQLPPAPAAVPRPVEHFTPRQLAVLERLKQGSANKIIAHELSMSEGTVKVHVRNIMKKLHATNRTQAVFRAYNLKPGTDGGLGTAGAKSLA